MNKNVHEKIAKKRSELGLTEEYVANQAGISIKDYLLIESNNRFIFNTLSIALIKNLCKVLMLDFFELFGIECAFCKLGNHYNEDFLLSRNQLLQKRREALNLSREEAAHRMRHYKVYIKSMEEYANYFEGSNIENAESISKFYNIPIQILLGIKCTECNR